jgi:hypothetical protein
MNASSAWSLRTGSGSISAERASRILSVSAGTPASASTPRSAKTASAFSTKKVRQ